jgi:hypothetical protein
MSDSIRESKHERKVRFHGEAPFAKHDYRYRSRGVIRMAGQVWAESAQERQNRLLRERTLKKTRQTPVGIGFGDDDSFGPDDTYKSVRFISNRPAPATYT